MFTNDNIFINNNKTLIKEFKKNTSQLVMFIKDMEQFNIQISKSENLKWIQDDLAKFRKLIRDSGKIDNMINWSDLSRIDIKKVRFSLIFLEFY